MATKNKKKPASATAAQITATAREAIAGLRARLAASQYPETWITRTEATSLAVFVERCAAAHSRPKPPGDPDTKRKNANARTKRYRAKKKAKKIEKGIDTGGQQA